MNSSPTPPAPAEVCERLKRIEISVVEGYDYDCGLTCREKVETIASAIALIEQGEKERLELGALHGRIGLFAAKWWLLSDNLPTEETFKQIEEQLADTANKYLQIMGERDDLCQQLAAATERVKRLEESLSDMVCMSETLIKNIAEFSKDPRILTTPSPRLDSARQLLAARAQPTPESK